MAPSRASARLPSSNMAATGPSFLSFAGPSAGVLPLVKMAPARASLPGFTARAALVPPRFRRKRRRERWRRLRFEFQRRRLSPNKSWIGGGGDLESRAGRDRRRNQGRCRHGHQCHHLLRVRDGLGVGRGRHPPRDAQRLQVRPGFEGFALTGSGAR